MRRSGAKDAAAAARASQSRHERVHVSPPQPARPTSCIVDHVSTLVPQLWHQARVWGRLCTTRTSLVLSSNDPNSATNYLVALHPEPVLRPTSSSSPSSSSTPSSTPSLPSSCVASTLALPHVVRDVVPLSDSSLLCALGHGEVQVVALSDTGVLRETRVRAHLISDCIRQIAVRPTAGISTLPSDLLSSLPPSAGNGAAERAFAMGGFDEELQVAVAGDARISALLPIPCGDYIGSIRWCEDWQFSCTLDAGIYRKYDLTQNNKDTPAIEVHCQKKDLYAHEYVDDFVHLLLGFGDGEMRLYDLRKPDDIVAQWFDPLHYAIGDLTYRADSRALLTSGAHDFRLWTVAEGARALTPRYAASSLISLSAYEHPAILAAQAAEVVEVARAAAASEEEEGAAASEAETIVFARPPRSFHAVFCDAPPCSTHHTTSINGNGRDDDGDGDEEDMRSAAVVALSSDGLLVVVHTGEDARERERREGRDSETTEIEGDDEDTEEDEEVDDDVEMAAVQRSNSTSSGSSGNGNPHPRRPDVNSKRRRR